MILHKCNYSYYNVRNCKSGRHNRRHSFKRHNIRLRPCPSNNTCVGLTVKYTTNSPHRQTRIVRANLSYQDDIIRQSTRFKSSLLHSDKFDMNNNHLSVNSTHTEYSILNSPVVISTVYYFSSILICVGLHSLVFMLVVEQPWLKPLCLTDW